MCSAYIIAIDKKDLRDLPIEIRPAIDYISIKIWGCLSSWSDVNPTAAFRADAAN
jgi:hypothetical protein